MAKCDLCTTDDGRPLVNPNKTGCASRDVSLKNFAATLLDYKRNGCLPQNFNMMLFKVGQEFESFEAKIMKMNIQYHKACRNKISDKKLEKLKAKRKEQIEEAKKINVSPVKKLRSSIPEESIPHDEKEPKDVVSSPPPKRKKPRGRPKKNRKEKKLPNDATGPPCAICFLPVPEQSEDSHECHTDDVSKNIKLWAEELNKSKITANLIVNSYDLHAADAVYHFKCYIDLRDEYRALTKRREMSKQDSEEGDDDDSKASAFNHVCEHIQEVKTSAQKSVFLLKYLFDMFLAQLYERGYFPEKNSLREVINAEDGNESEIVQGQSSVPAYRKVNRTQFKLSLLKSFPGLTESIRNNQVYLIFEEDICESFHSTSINENAHSESDEIVLSKALELLQSYSTPQEPFNGVFLNGCERNAVDNRVLDFILKWITGAKTDDDLNEDSARLRQALTIAQIVEYNSIKYERKEAPTVRHLAYRETPQQVYISMKLYEATRSKKLINEFHELGLCISYKRLMEILSAMESTVVKKYEEEQVVYPLTLPTGTFTTIEADNLDR